MPWLKWFGGVSVQMAAVSNPPLAIASNGSGMIYGLFSGSRGYYLAVSRDLESWNVTSRGVIPSGYDSQLGRDLAITNAGVVIVAATRLVANQNFTIFRSSFDHGLTFQTVLNVSLKAEPLTLTGSSTGPGGGFWHGVAESTNGYLFAGLYNPQGLIFRSTDGAHTWHLVFNASRYGDWHNEIHDVEVDNTNNNIFATTDDEAGARNNQSIWVSTDYGNNWTLVYSATKGGAALPVGAIPLSVGFLDQGNLVAVGLDNSDPSLGRSIFVLAQNPDGCLRAVYQVLASKSEVDPFYAWYMYPNNDSVFVLTYSVSLSHDHGVGLFEMSPEGNLTLIMTLVGENGFPEQFAQMAGPTSLGTYGVIAFVNDQRYLLVVRNLSQFG